MTSSESTLKEATVLKPSESSQVHHQVFSDAKDFIGVLQNNYSALSRNHDVLSLPDLQLDAHDANLPANLREAAAITAQHYDSLTKMAGERQQLVAGDLGLIDDKIEGNEIAYGVSSLVQAATGGAVMGSIGGLMGVSAGAGMLGEGVTALGLGTAAGAVGFIGMGGYLVYLGVKGVMDASAEAKADNAAINAWIR